MSTTRLSDADIQARLPAGWQYRDGGLHRRFEFPDYHRTMAFVNAVAWIAHRSDHHPDLGVHYGHCDVRYSTHSAGGVTALDLDAVREVDALTTSA